mgnify:CR=1 FL=1
MNTDKTTKEIEKQMDFVVTKEILAAASDYVPLAQKTALAKEQAEIIVQRAKETTGVKTDGGAILPLPPRYFADEQARSVLEMSIFATLYLHTEEMQDGNIVMDTETYDRYAGSHVFGQLAVLRGEIGKTDPALKAKIINMVSDFNDYQKRLTAEIRALMTLYNDPVDRFLAMNAALSTPEGMEGLLSELKEAAEEVEKYKTAEKDGEGE